LRSPIAYREYAPADVFSAASAGSAAAQTDYRGRQSYLRDSKMRCKLLTLLLATTVCSSLPANTKPVFVGVDGRTLTSAEVDETVSRAMKGGQVPGLALALINGGRVVYLHTYGVKNMSPNQPLTVNSVMVAASLTKVAFTYLVMQLVDDQVIDLDKPVYQYLPRPFSDYPAWRDIADDPRSKLITARMLLSHTAGFNNARYFDPDHRLVIHFQPGARYSYGSEGYRLLQLVVETVTKKPIEELMQERVFGPLGMRRTSLIWQGAFETDYANGYDEYGRLLGHQRRKTADAAGSLQTTITDYSRLTQAVLSGHDLGPESHAQMLSVQIPVVSKVEFPPLLSETTDQYKSIELSYGLGVGLYHTPHGWAFFKEGHDEGWRTYMVCHRDQATCMVILTNSSNGEGIYSALLKGLLGDTWNPIDWEVLTPYDQLPPRKPLSDHTAVQVPPAWLAMLAGRYGTQNDLLTVEAEGDHLLLIHDGRPRRELFPQTWTIFFSKSSDETFTFLFDIDTWAFRILRETAGKDELIPNLDWERQGVAAP
jgi:CubicO group peptidase (beta-lactamase class C family)